MGLANKTVVLYRYGKIDGKWKFQKSAESRLKRLSAGSYYINWYEGKKKRLVPVGPEQDVALAALNKNRAELGYIANGGRIDPAENGAEDDKRTKVTAAIAEYLAVCHDRQGKSGYGLATRTVETYDGRSRALLNSSPTHTWTRSTLSLSANSADFSGSDLTDRSCYNIMQAVSTFLTR